MRRSLQQLRICFAFAMAVAAACIAATANAADPASASAQPPSLSLDLELEPAQRSVRARAELVPASQDFQFTLHESLKITSAKAAGKALRIEAGGQDGPVRAWRIVMPSGEHALQIDYEGKLPALDKGLDHRGVLKAMPPAASAEGSFLPAGAGWYPQPAPLFSYRVHITVPGDQRPLVPGRITSETIPAAGGQSYRASFEFAEPANGIDLMVGPYVVREKTMLREDGEPLRLRTYFTRELDATPGLADAYLDDMGRYLQRYAAQIGAYPFAGFSVVASPLPTGFGMPTVAYLGSDVIRLPFIRATSLGHEVLHNWWGNGVYVASGSGNWSEGLTTFMADYATKEQESAEAAREMRLGWLRDVASVPASAQLRLSEFQSRAHGATAAVGYGKSAMVFVMLRDLIGPEQFDKGIRLFWDRYRFRHAGWADLRKAFEDASSRPLGDFFDQWLHRRGGPGLSLLAARASGNGSRLQLEFRQAMPVYRLRVPLELVYAGGRSEIRWVDVGRQRERIDIPVSAMPSSVRLDPELRLWRSLEQEQLPPILRRWFIAADPRIAIASSRTEVREAAGLLAQRLHEVPPRLVRVEGLRAEKGPVLLMGLHADIDRALAQARLPPRPQNVTGKGSAQVWTIAGADVPVAVVSAANAAALKDLQRPLPHYGAQSWLVFEGSRAQGCGVWPATGKMIPVLQP
jgi:aminopeptidase N